MGKEKIIQEGEDKMIKPAVQNGVRELTNKGGTKIITFGYSYKMDVLLPFESPLERDFAYYAEINDNVISYDVQPFKLKFTFEGKKHTYTPDVRLYMKYGRPQIVEVKLLSKYEELKPFFQRVKNELNDQGHGFWVATDNLIRIKPVLSNLKLLYKYACEKVSPDQVKYIIQHLSSLNEPVTIKDIVKCTMSRGVILNHIYHLCFKGVIAVDFSASINPNSKINLNSKGYIFKGGDLDGSLIPTSPKNFY